MDGYRFKSKSLADAQSVIAKIRKSVQDEMGKLYAGWLGETCAEICDMVALGRMERSERPIMDIAREIILGRVQEAGSLALPTAYNIRVLLRVFQKGKYCYIQGEPAGTALFDAIAKTKDVEDFGLSTTEMREGGSARRMEWEAVFSAYRDGQREPFICDVTPALNEGDNEIIFPGVPERVEALARRSAMEDYLAVVSRKMPIPPQDLMRRIDEAFAYILSPAGKLAMDAKKEQLLRILVDLEAHPEIIYGEVETAFESASDANMPSVEDTQNIADSHPEGSSKPETSIDATVDSEDPASEAEATSDMQSVSQME